MNSRVKLYQEKSKPIDISLRTHWTKVVKNSNRIKDGKLRLILEEAEVRRIMRNCIIYIFRNMLQSTFAALMEPIRRTEVKVRVGKVKNRKAAGND